VPANSIRIPLGLASVKGRHAELLGINPSPLVARFKPLLIPPLKKARNPILSRRKPSLAHSSQLPNRFLTVVGWAKYEPAVSRPFPLDLATRVNPKLFGQFRGNRHGSLFADDNGHQPYFIATNALSLILSADAPKTVSPYPASSIPKLSQTKSWRRRFFPLDGKARLSRNARGSSRSARLDPGSRR
jgi:hypothetical protein